MNYLNADESRVNVPDVRGKTTHCEGYSARFNPIKVKASVTDIHNLNQIKYLGISMTHLIT